MPTYEYECSECGHRFELFQNIKDQPLKTCPKCGKKVNRLIGTGGGIIFRGSGFYCTDYPKKPKRQEPAKKENPTCPKAKEGCSGCS
jgi:putative FmdB family regulatory protein